MAGGHTIHFVPNNTWGYDTLVDGRIRIHKPSVPCQPGPTVILLNRHRVVKRAGLSSKQKVFRNSETLFYYQSIDPDQSAYHTGIGYQPGNIYSF